jgi:hypothetical protein
MKKALVIGCGPDVWNEVAKAQTLCEFDRIYCIKLAGVFWPDFFHTWVTLHPEFMDDYEKQRKEKGYPNGYEIVSPPSSEVGAHGQKGNIARRISYRWPGMNASGSSGIYGAKVALDDGHDRVVLAGIPMEATNHFSRGTPWKQRDSFMVGYETAVPKLRGKVKSMSGKTRKDLGEPTSEWLQGDPVAVPSVKVQA